MWKRWRIRIFLFLAVLGPGFITANVDNDSGGILTYSQAGAQYGYTLLWTMIPITIALIVVQEMCARMGVVTGKGLSDLIREEFGLRITFVLMVLLVVVNYTNVVTEFIGIAGSLRLFHVTKFISVPLCAFLVWYMVVRGTYKSTEKTQPGTCFRHPRHRRRWSPPPQPRCPMTMFRPYRHCRHRRRRTAPECRPKNHPRSEYYRCRWYSRW